MVMQDVPLQMPRGNHPLSSAATLPDQVLALLLAYPDRYNVHDFKGLMSSYKSLSSSASSPPRSSPGSLYKVHNPSAERLIGMQAITLGQGLQFRASVVASRVSLPSPQHPQEVFKDRDVGTCHTCDKAHCMQAHPIPTSEVSNLSTSAPAAPSSLGFSNDSLL